MVARIGYGTMVARMESKSSVAVCPFTLFSFGDRNLPRSLKVMSDRYMSSRRWVTCKMSAGTKKRQKV